MCSLVKIETFIRKKPYKNKYHLYKKNFERRNFCREQNLAAKRHESGEEVLLREKNDVCEWCVRGKEWEAFLILLRKKWICWWLMRAGGCKAHFLLSALMLQVVTLLGIEGLAHRVPRPLKQPRSLNC